jgi:hypothetical protein
MIEVGLTVLTILAAAGSAVLWIAASRVRIPGLLNDNLVGEGPFSAALKRQSKLNAYAAISAAIASGLQAATLVAHLLVR